MVIDLNDYSCLLDLMLKVNTNVSSFFGSMTPRLLCPYDLCLGFIIPVTMTPLDLLMSIIGIQQVKGLKHWRN